MKKGHDSAATRKHRYLIRLMTVITGASLFFISCRQTAGDKAYPAARKIAGISFVGANEPVSREDVLPMKKLGATWVSLMPYGFVREKEHVVHYNTQWQWWGETDEGLLATTKLAKDNGLKVMIKPQVWFRHGKYTGHYIPPDSGKIAFNESFAEFVLHFAEVAQKAKADLYCIGTEWHNYIDSDPEFWQQLIVKVKNIYTGKLTYAANWDEYKTVPFWPELDYIGVNAYFPLSEDDFPAPAALAAGWQPWLKELKIVAEQEKKPILFTEYGYRSIVGNAHRPWEASTKQAISLANQEVAYRALYEQFWPQPWFAGGFAWKWFHNYDERGGDGHLGYTPQNKPVEAVIKEYYAK